MGKLIVQGTEITIVQKNKEDYICLTDIVKGFEGGSSLIENWLRNLNTIEFLGIWEQLNNESFNSIEFEGIKNQAGTNRFTLSAKKWVNSTNAIGVMAKAGRYGGTYAHKDIALEFCSWLSPEFKLYLIKEFQRLKDDELESKTLDWNLTRSLSKINYRIHTDAVKANLIPQKISKNETRIIFASEADVLNKALFGMTAKEWRTANPDKKGNMRDDASVEQLIVLSNLESLNAEFEQFKRLKKLNDVAISQMKSLIDNPSMKVLKNINKLNKN